MSGKGEGSEELVGPFSKFDVEEEEVIVVDKRGYRGGQAIEGVRVEGMRKARREQVKQNFKAQEVWVAAEDNEEMVPGLS